MACQFCTMPGGKHDGECPYDPTAHGRSLAPVADAGFDFSHYQPGDVLCMSREDIAKRGMTDVFIILSALAQAAGRAGLLIEPQINDVEMRVVFK